VCDTVVVVEPGRVLFAKNSDRDANEAQLLDWQPRATHPPHSRLRATWIEIDQVEETCAVLLSRPFWMWGAEIGTNEHDVTIGNEAVFTREPYQDQGLTGMDLLRLALERSADAVEAVEVIITLLERHGQGGGCGHERRDFTYHNSFIVADPRRAYVVETAGRHWVVDEVTSGARSISNGLTDPAFAARYADRLRTRVTRSRRRRAITGAAARRASGVGDLMALLRDHGSGGRTPRYSLLTGAMGAPCAHPSGLIASTQTTASWVAELAPTGSSHWVTGTAAPCTGLFKPVSVAEPLDLGPPPTDRFDGRCLWWRHELLHRRALIDPDRLVSLFAAERDEVEARWRAAPPRSVDAFDEGDRRLAAWTASVLDGLPTDRRPPWVRHYWKVRDRRAGLPAAVGPVTMSGSR
jgi:secernin